MIYIGIDPGKSGAIVYLDDKGSILSITDRKNFDVKRLADERNCIAALEEVHAMPKQGVSSTFKFGEEFGWWKGILTAKLIAYYLVTPNTWHKALKIKKIADADAKQRKRAVYEEAIRLYPNAELRGAKGGILDGRSDALMLARYCYLRENGLLNV